MKEFRRRAVGFVVVWCRLYRGPYLETRPSIVRRIRATTRMWRNYGYGKHYRS